KWLRMSVWLIVVGITENYKGKNVDSSFRARADPRSAYLSEGSASAKQSIDHTPRAAGSQITLCNWSCKRTCKPDSSSQFVNSSGVTEPNTELNNTSKR